MASVIYEEKSTAWILYQVIVTYLASKFKLTLLFPQIMIEVRSCWSRFEHKMTYHRI